MIKRISKDEAREWKSLLEGHRTFRLMYDPLRKLSREGELMPEEVWLEATREVVTLAKSSHPHFALKHLDEDLIDRYSSFEGVDGIKVSREKSLAERTMVIVVLTMLYKLVEACKEYDNHPNAKTCSQIGEMLSHYPLTAELLKQYKPIDDEMDNEGDHFEARDYLKQDLESALDKVDTMTAKGLLRDMIDDIRKYKDYESAKNLYDIITRQNKAHNNIFEEEENELLELRKALGKAEAHISGSNVVMGDAINPTFQGRTIGVNETKKLDYGKR